MALQHYWRKRDFERTPEPRGKRPGKTAGHRFVIQKHAARRLHYDFRLELDGTLKSWAIPKGPSLASGERRLAVHVEDHPLEYGKFEGVIPPGQYGSGSVIVWDRGTWHPEGDARAGYRKGHLRFRLDGEKLRGTWNLVRTNTDSSGKENWLLIKSDDEYASGEDIVATAPLSVQTGRSIDDVAAAPDREWHSNKKPSQASVKTRRRGKEKKMHAPASLKPELATLVDRAPEGDQWLHEIKHDGYRVLARVANGRATLTTRNGLDLTTRMTAVARAIEKIPGLKDAWLDGEVVVPNADGHSDFGALQLALSEGRDSDMVYYVFDLPFAGGKDLRERPLRERKETLRALLKTRAQAALRFGDHVQASGPAFHQQACDMGLEGIVSKRADSPYRAGRGEDWLKTKCRLRQEFVIVGYTDPGGSRKGFGALLLAVNDHGKLRYAGRTGTGFSDKILKSLSARLKKMARNEPPFKSPIPREARRGAHWVEPTLVAEIEFASWTRDGLARQAAFQGLREDKPAREVVHEQARPLEKTKAKTKPDNERAKGGQAPRLTNPDKVLYPDMGLTKTDLAAYYTAVEDWLLPHLVRRPLTLVRCPEGRQKACFYQKHAMQGTVPELSRVPIKEKNERRVYLALDSLKGVLALVQMGVLEVHTWGSRIDNVEYPDQLVFDLDPDPTVPWPRVVDAAALTYARLADLGLYSFLRTTGGKGLHVVVPIERRLRWDEAKAFAKAFAEDIVRQHPDRYTARLPIAARKGKIFVDYLRNGRGATAITNYSTRARPGATVATPLAWNELSPELRPQEFNVLTVPQRLNSLDQDPWMDFNDARRPITIAMKRALGMGTGR
jgi:bifunctional non-homologous end joining protein LigD